MFLKCLALLLLANSATSKCVNNARYVFEQSWQNNNQKVAYHKGVIMPNFSSNLILRQWTLKIIFAKKLVGFKTWRGRVKKGGSGNKTVILRSKSYNKKITRDTFSLPYIAGFRRNLRGNHFVCAQFCGKLPGSKKNVCPPNATESITTAPPKTATQAPTSSDAIVTTLPPSRTKSEEIKTAVSETTVKQSSTNSATLGKSLATSPPTMNSCASVFRITYQWITGYNAEFSITFPSDVKDWVIIFEVDKPFKSIQAATADVDLSLLDENKYMLINKDYNGVQASGNIISQQITVAFDEGKAPKVIAVQLESSSLDSTSDLCKTTARPTTNAATITLPGQSSSTGAAATTANPIKTEDYTTTTVNPINTEDSTTTTANPISTETLTTSVVTKQPTCTPNYDYADVLGKSLLFYEAQRSGKLPANQRVKWRKDSALNDGSDQNPKIDLTGGYYDAGDYVKFGFPMASSITNLAWGMIKFKNGYKNSGEYKNGLEALKWGTDYFIKCHPSKFVFYGQVGDGDADHSYWGRPEDMAMPRPSFKIDANKPGSDLAGETAAAMAATSIVFRDAGDLAYADTLLTHAKDLYEFADKYRGVYTSSIPQAAKFYNSFSGFQDELAWGSLWLFSATGDESYKSKYLNEYAGSASTVNLNEFSWDNKWAGVIVLAKELGVSNSLSNFKKVLSKHKFSPRGLYYVMEWGTTRHAANLAFLSLIASQLDSTDKMFYQQFARGQIDYILGDGGRSYVIGFGNNPPKRPHHRSSSCPSSPQPCGWSAFNSPAPNPHTLVGALVGGPGQFDDYEDKRDDFKKNEVAMDYNAGFQSAVAGFAELAYNGEC